MSVTLAGIEFEDHEYDARGDVLYLFTAGYDAGLPLHASVTAEGHGVEYDTDRRVIALTLVNVKWLIARDGELTITWPEAHVQPNELTALFAAV